MDESLKKAILLLGEHFLSRNYDYVWLKAMLKKGRTVTVPGSTLITGSSYALFGIQENLWKNAINCSAPSQDLYYDFQCARRVISPENGRFFERCFIIIGYYGAFQDLSLSKEERMSRIPGVFYPVFHDAHHWDCPVEIDPWAAFGFGNVPKQLKMVCETAAVNKILEAGTYHTDFRPRFTGYVAIRRRGGWSQAPEQDRLAAGAHRAEQHNRIAQHKASLEENKRIFQEYICFLYSYGIMPVLVIPPFSEEYNRCVLKEVREGMLELVDSVPEEVHYVDFNEAPILFGPEDFTDSDHLSVGGAEKMSSILVDMFGE